MASNKIEDIHKLLLNKLLSDSGLECVRSASESLHTSTASGESVEQGTVEVFLSIPTKPNSGPIIPSDPSVNYLSLRNYQPDNDLQQDQALYTVIFEPEEEQIKEELVPEEATAQIEEEFPEEQSEVFPTPSLRKVLPEKIRNFEKQNRIHVLPEEFRSDINPELIPKIAITAQQNYIDVLGELTGCTTYRQSLAEYWFLDTLANLLRRAQEDEMCRSSQAVLILWFCEWMKEMQHFDAADRERMLRRFKDNMLSAAKYIAEEQNLPSPQKAGVFYKAEDTEAASVLSARSPDSKHLVTFEGAAYECSLRDLTSIIHYIFDLFSTDYQFNLVRAIFTSSPDYTLIDVPYQIRIPKKMFTPLKLKPRVEQKEKPQKGKGKKEIETEEYLALMKLKAQDIKEQNAMEDRDQEAWHRRSHILPLAFATSDDFLDKYWPPPPPEPAPVAPDTKGKGKKKK